MNTLWKVVLIAALAILSGCISHTREVVREQPIVQQQPSERAVIVQPQAAPAEIIVR